MRCWLLAAGYFSIRAVSSLPPLVGRLLPGWTIIVVATSNQRERERSSGLPPAGARTTVFFGWNKSSESKNLWNQSRITSSRNPYFYCILGSPTSSK